MNNVGTTSGKDVWINLRVNPQVREEFKVAADLKGSSMSGLLHLYIIKVIREEKERNLEAFNRALEAVRANEDKENHKSKRNNSNGPAPVGDPLYTPEELERLKAGEELTDSKRGGAKR